MSRNRRFQAILSLDHVLNRMQPFRAIAEIPRRKGYFRNVSITPVAVSFTFNDVIC
jgi:hypothetical protein